MEGPDKDLHALLQSQGELIGSIAHDLKGLINGIEGGMSKADAGFVNFLMPAEAACVYVLICISATRGCQTLRVI